MNLVFIFRTAVPPGLFNQNVTGRVSPTRSFTAFEDSIEYFLALSLVPNQAEADIVDFTPGCAEAAASYASKLGQLIPHLGVLVNRSDTTTLKQNSVDDCLSQLSRQPFKILMKPRVTTLRAERFMSSSIKPDLM